MAVRPYLLPHHPHTIASDAGPQVMASLCITNLILWADFMALLFIGLLCEAEGCEELVNVGGAGVGDGFLKP